MDILDLKYKEKDIIAESDASKFNLEELFCLLDGAPLGISIWNSNKEGLFCNANLLKLFGFDTKEQFFENIKKLTPLKQPDGSFSKDSLSEYQVIIKEKGDFRFNWLFKNLNGEEFPTEIKVNRLNIKDSDGKYLYAIYITDLRPQLAGYNVDKLSDGFFYNSISDRELFNSVAELSDEWFWAFDVAASQIQFFGKGRAILNLSDKKQDFPKEVVESGIVYPDDMDNFLKMAEAMRGDFIKPYDVRFILPNGTARWYRVTYKTIYNNQGKPIFTIGKTFDIHEQKTFEALSRTDLLTNCLNKITTEESVANIIADHKSEVHAMFIIDVDDFKSINDNLGHYFGDIVLREISNNLHANFREGDVIGRIGGDEFIVFIKNVSNKKIIINKAEAVAKAFKNNYKGENGNYKVSGSIGIALYPNDGTTYEDLYKSVDKALYQSKLSGKDCYTFYTEELSDGTMKNLTIVENANRLANSYFDSELVSTVFDIMYGSDDILISLNTALQYICNKMVVDRAYILETPDAGETYSVTYEWCTNTVKGHMDHVRAIPKDILQVYLWHLEHNNVYYCNDSSYLNSKDAYSIVNEQKIKSFMFVHVKDDGHTKLMLGLDDCVKPRVWSEKEINSVKYALKMISIFILYKNI